MSTKKSSAVRRQRRKLTPEFSHGWAFSVAGGRHDGGTLGAL
jgi:hypothetical protein